MRLVLAMKTINSYCYILTIFGRRGREENCANEYHVIKRTATALATLLATASGLFGPIIGPSWLLCAVLNNVLWYFTRQEAIKKHV
jgi:hypothetical protein